jgi:hypothetical protein
MSPCLRACLTAPVKGANPQNNRQLWVRAKKNVVDQHPRTTKTVKKIKGRTENPCPACRNEGFGRDPNTARTRWSILRARSFSSFLPSRSPAAAGSRWHGPRFDPVARWRQSADATCFSRGRRGSSDLHRCRADGGGHEREQEEEGGYAPHPDSVDDRPCPSAACRPCPCEANEGSPHQSSFRWRQGIEGEEAGFPHRPPAGHSLSASRRVPRRLPCPEPVRADARKVCLIFPHCAASQHA